MNKDQNKLSILITLIIIALVIWIRPLTHNESALHTTVEGMDLFQMTSNQDILISTKQQYSLYYSETKINLLRKTTESEYKVSPFQ